MVGEVDVLKAVFLAVEGAHLNGEDQVVELSQEGLDAIVILALRVGDILLELQPEIQGLFVLEAFLVVGLVLVRIGLLVAGVPEELDLLEDVQHAEDVLNGFIEHIGLLLLLDDIIVNRIAVEPLDQSPLVLRLGLVVLTLDAVLLRLIREDVQQVLLDDHPQELRLAFRQKFPDEAVIVALEVAESQLDAFLVNFLKQGHGLIVTLWDEVEFPIGEVFLAHEEVCEVGEIFEEGALHEGDLVVDAGQLGDLVDEVKQGLGDADHLIVHDLEELPEEQGGGLDEVDGVGLLLGALEVVGLTQQELLHGHVAVLAEELQEAEHPAEGQLAGLLIPGLELVKS